MEHKVRAVVISEIFFRRLIENKVMWKVKFSQFSVSCRNAAPCLSGVLKISSHSVKRRYHSSLGVGRDKMLVFSEMSEQVFITDNLFHWPESIQTMYGKDMVGLCVTLWIFYLVFLLTIFCKVEDIFHVFQNFPNRNPPIHFRHLALILMNFTMCLSLAVKINAYCLVFSQ